MATAGRLTCPRCGANNFDTVTSCWKCSAPLSSGGSAPGAAMPASPYTLPERPHSAAPVMTPAVHYPVSQGDSGVARRAAIALALTFPWLGLPVGWIFMMIEDRSKQTIGRVCAVWSAIALIFHLLLMFVAMQSIGSVLTQTLQILKSAQQSPSEGGGEPGAGVRGFGGTP